MEVGDRILYAKILKGTKSIVSLKIRTIYDDVIICIDDKGMALPVSRDRVFTREKDAQDFLDNT